MTIVLITHSFPKQHALVRFLLPFDDWSSLVRLFTQSVCLLVRSHPKTRVKVQEKFIWFEAYVFCFPDWLTLGISCARENEREKERVSERKKKKNDDDDRTTHTPPLWFPISTVPMIREWWILRARHTIFLTFFRFFVWTNFLFVGCGFV